MRKFLFIFVLLFLAHTAWSQNANFVMDVSQLRAETVYFDIEDSPYFEDNYRFGYVYFRGEKYNLFFRFNAVEDRVELKDRTTKLFYMTKNTILEPSFGGKTYKYIYYLQGDDLKQGYLVRLLQGEDVSLYIKHRKVYQPAESPDHGYEGFTPPKYRDVSEYYLQFGRQLPQPLKLNKRQLLKRLKDKETEMEQYILQQELDLRQEKDALKLIEYYNRLATNQET